MSAEQDFTWLRCHCDFCMGQGDEGAVFDRRSYYVPDPPKIPLPPGSTATTAPPPEQGYTGPRHHTLLRGDDWNDPQVGVPAVIPYTFATRAMSYYSTGEDDRALPGFAGTSGEALDAVQRASIRQALSMWEQVSGLTFVEVSDPEVWDFHGIRFLMESVDVYGLLGRTYPGDDPYGFNIAFNRTEYADATLQPGTLGFWTALHEIGHAIGLKHPFDGDPVLRLSEDHNNNTVMSYTNEGNLSRLGPFDAAAAQHIYGGPEAKAWAPVRWFQGAGGSMLILADHQDNYVMGSVAPDVVHAGAGDDYITLDAGDDYVVPGAGTDAVFGGAGADTLYTGVLWRQAATAVDLSDGADIKGTVAKTDGTDTFYGVETVAYADLAVALDFNGAVGQVFRLYQAAFGRRPDPMGLSHWADALQDGSTTLAKVAASFVRSAEFNERFGAASTYDFVKTLYENVLDREPGPSEGAEVGYWVNAVFVGGRGGVLLGFSNSEENQNKTRAGFGNGLWYPNEDAVDVLRAYVAVLDRRPDADGLITWTNAREAGLPQGDMVALLATSPEFQARFGALSNRDFAELLYGTALDRPATANEGAYWAWILDAGIDTRAGVALAFANSAEMTAKITPFVSTAELYA